MDCQVRLATTGDAASINHVVISALRESNAQDYPPDVIARVPVSGALFIAAAYQLELKVYGFHDQVVLED
ncbi:hypothetical protein [Pseudomonas silesiensis]|jgi:hypothetical protein|uniref:hypothetical protein n=1 Tax=Pseudomonas silesiensis TaxID=1853130 RepID=UPI003862149D